MSEKKTCPFKNGAECTKDCALYYPTPTHATTKSHCAVMGIYEEIQK